MVMPVSQEEMMKKISSERRARIEMRANELIEEEMTLRDLRKAQQLTQAAMATKLGLEQDSVSRLERLLSTMSGYVEAMGGKLQLMAEFPNRKPIIIKLNDLAS
jgi:DNA-binding XRE family transcriptional regulator